jgi:dsRNA-specific ribonuclease
MNLLFKLAKDKEKAWCAAEATFQHFDQLPENVRNKLLILLVSNENAARIVALTVSEKFDMLQDVRNELLLNLTSQELLL